MTKEEVLNIIIKVLRKLDAVDPHSPDAFVAQTKLPALPLLQHSLAKDRDLKKETLYNQMVDDLKDAHPNNVKPVIAPQEPSVFDKDITINELAAQIAKDTPDQII